MPPWAHRRMRGCRRSGPGRAETALTLPRSSIVRRASPHRLTPGRSRRGCEAWWLRPHRPGDLRTGPRTPTRRPDSQASSRRPLTARVCAGSGHREKPIAEDAEERRHAEVRHGWTRAKRGRDREDPRNTSYTPHTACVPGVLSMPAAGLRAGNPPGASAFLCPSAISATGLSPCPHNRYSPGARRRSESASTEAATRNPNSARRPAVNEPVSSRSHPNT